MIDAGLCSVTLRALPPEDVAALSRRVGLATVEWGADVHAPPDDPALLARCVRAARDHGLRVVSYGSYWRAGTSTLDEGVRVLEAAQALGCRRVRVWAGTTGSADTDAVSRTPVLDALRRLADLAEERGLELALEHHPGTLSDTATATLRLLEEVGPAAISTYWQPAVGQPADAALAELSLLLGTVPDRVSAVHVFSWWPETERLPLAARHDLWRPALAALTAAAPSSDVLLEFVEGDSAEALERDAATLTGWLGSAAAS